MHALALVMLLTQAAAPPLRVLVQQDTAARQSDDFLPPQANPVQRELELLTAFAEAEKRSLELVPVANFSELIPALLANQGDVIAAGLTVTDARKKQLAFTRPTMSVDELLVTKSGTPNAPRTPEQLKGRTVVIPKGTSYAEALGKIAGVTINERDGLQTPDQLAQEVSDGVLDLTVIDSVRFAVIKHYLPKLEALFPLAKGRGIAFALKPADTALKSKLDAFLIAYAFEAEDANETGDLPVIEKRKTLRVLTRNNAVSFYLYKGNRDGFDYELIKAFAKSKGLTLEVVLAPSYADLIPLLKAGQGDVIAASFTATPERAKDVNFTRPYLIVSELFVQRKGKSKLATLEDLKGRTVVVRASSSYAEKLRPLAAQYGFTLNAAPEDLEVEDLLADVDEGVIDLTVADSHFFEAEAMFRKGLEAPLSLSSQGASIAFATRTENPLLLAALDAWVKKVYRGLEYNVLKKHCFENRGALTEARELSTAKTGVLSPYDQLIKKYSTQYGFDWRLMSAQAWRESRFDPKAKSFAGALGLFQVMPATGKELGFTKLTDADQGTHAGIKYMNQLVQRLEPSLPLDERVRFALAGYNAGFGRVQDARRLAKELSLDPNVWANNVEKAMGLMARPQYAKRVRTGFCRCQEPVDYVKHIENKYQSFVQLVP